MTNRPQPIILQPGAGRAIGLVGDVYRFLATGEETGGKYSLCEAVVLPGGGPPPHVHSREVEAFYVLEGEITFSVAGDRFVAGPGAFANVPIGCLHAFKNETQQPARMLITVAPAGLEKMFFELGQPVDPTAPSAAPPTKEAINKLVTVAAKYGVEIRLPPHGTAPAELKR
jgi:quercetin dioxygenase-like cupin family protein